MVHGFAQSHRAGANAGEGAGGVVAATAPHPSVLSAFFSYALRKKEEQQPGGNLARATHSAYNGGPGQLARYRAARQNPELKKVDEAFWDKFQVVSSGRELEVQRCYEK